MQGKRNEVWWVSRALIGSTEYRETVLRRLLFQRTGFYSNKFTRHFPMDPNACPCYPSQPGITQTFPQVSFTRTPSQLMRGVKLHPRGSSQPPSVQVQFTVHQNTQWSSGEGACSQMVATSTSGPQDGL
jgi:hypothetical protein